MIEFMEKVTSTRIVFEAALREYVNACYSLRDSCARGVFSSNELNAFTSQELAFLASHETTIHLANALIGTCKNLSTTAIALPVEVLSCIFQILQGNSKDPYPFGISDQLGLVSRVCSRWYHVALGTPSLWSKLELFPYQPKSKQNVARAKAYANRAKGFPLQLRIVHLGHPSYKPKAREEVPVLEFLKLVAPRTRSLKLVAPLVTSGFYTKALHICLAGGVNRIKIQNMVDHFSPQSGLIESTDQPREANSIVLNVPRQEFEGLWHPVTALSLDGAFIRWDSKAYHGLVDLRLGSCTHRFGIPQSQLYDILAASPGLRVIRLEVLIRNRVSSKVPLTPVVLEDLEELNLSGLDFRYLGSVLRLLAPGPKLGRISIDLRDAKAYDSPFDKLTRAFFDRTTSQRLDVCSIRSLVWIRELHSLLPHVRCLVLSLVYVGGLDELSTTSSINVSGPPSSVDQLYLCWSNLPLPSLRWILDTYHVRNLTLWRAEVSSSQKKSIQCNALTRMLAQNCSLVKVVDKDAPRPVPKASRFMINQ